MRTLILILMAAVFSGCACIENINPCQGYWHRQATATFACSQIENCRFDPHELQYALLERERHPECFVGRLD